MKLVGAAAIPAGSTQLHCSYNLAVLIADDEHVEVLVRYRFFALFFSLAGLQKVDDRPGSGYGWSARWWEDISGVATSRKSVIFYPRDGRGCRFATRRASTIRPLFDLIDARSIPRENLTTTIGRGYRL